MWNQKIARLAKALQDDLVLRLTTAANPNPVVVAYDASNDLYLTVTRGVGDAAIVKFEVQPVEASGQYDSLGIAQTVYSPHVTKLGIDFGGPGTAASDTATLLAALTAGDILTVNTHAFTAENSGAAGDQFNLVGTGATDTLTMGGGANTAFGAGKTITINVGGGPVVLTEGADFAAGANAVASSTAIKNAINAAAGLNTKVVATSVAGDATHDSTVTVTAINLGTAGNAYTAATNDVIAVWSSATFAPGALNLTATAVNAAAAIAASATAGVHSVVTATSNLAVVTITAVSVGVAGNSIPVTQTGGHITVATVTLQGGVNVTAAGTSDTLKFTLVAECAPTATALIIYEKAGIAVTDLINEAYRVATIQNLPWGMLAQV